MNDNQDICIKCGVIVGNGNSYCSNCGGAVGGNSDYCMSCGVAIKPKKPSGKASASGEYLGGQDKITMALLCFFLGGFGIHNFMMGEKKKGIIKLVLVWCGISEILALIDFVKILTDSYVVDRDKVFFAKKPKSELIFAIAYSVIALLVTAFLLIPYYSKIYYISNYYHFSFVGVAEGISAVVFLLLLANPIVSFFGIIRKRDQSLNNLVISVILFVLVLTASITLFEGEVYVMFWLTMILLTVQLMLSIAKVIISLLGRSKQ